VKVSPIRSEENYEQALARAQTLMPKEDPRSLDELEVLSALIERWERTQYQFAAPTPVDAIRFRMSQLNLQPRDLEPLIGSRGRVSEILTGTRSLSLDMVRALSHHLGVPAAALIGGPDAPPPPRAAPLSGAALERLRQFDVMKPNEEVSAFVARAFGASPSPAMLRKTRTERTNAKTDFVALDAWCAAVLVKAQAVKIPGTGKTPSDQAGAALARLSRKPDGPARAAGALRKFGVVLVVLEHLPGTYLDGAAMCRGDGIPVIALTLRHNRLDNFWFTLLHEFCHVTRHLTSQRRVIFDDLELRSSDQIEAEADKYAQDTLIPPAIWRKHVSADLTTEELMLIADEAQVHHAVVAGRWQREFGDYRRFAKMLGRGEVRAQLT
jgi:HTH-type transcriptional regulator/antitoxin HigA